MTGIKRKISNLINCSFLSAMKLMPIRSLLAVKSSSRIIRKMDYGKRDIYLDIESDIEYELRLHSCKKEPETVSWIEEFFKEGDIFYDIGANVGAYSLVAAQFYRGRVKTYSFEPGFATYVKLCKNIALNKCQDHIFPFQVAFSDKTVIDFLNYSNVNPGGALHSFGAPLDYKGDSFAPVLKLPVLSYTVDDFIEQFKTGFPNHIKIDVDGIEPKIIKGAQKTLKDSRLKTLLIELNEDLEEHMDILGVLNKNGFLVRYKQHAEAFDHGQFSKCFNYVLTRN